MRPAGGIGAQIAGNLSYIKTRVLLVCSCCWIFSPYLQDALHVRYLKDIALGLRQTLLDRRDGGTTVTVPEELRPFTACFRLPLPTPEELRTIVYEPPRTGATSTR